MDKIILEEFVNTIKEEVDKLKKYLLVNPEDKKIIESMSLDNRFYNVSYNKLIEKGKIYITDKKGYDALFNGDYIYYKHMDYLPHTPDINNKSIDRGATKPFICGVDKKGKVISNYPKGGE